MKYSILRHYSVEKLESLVSEGLERGWKLQGGVSVAQSDYHSENHEGSTQDNFSQIFIQAMTFEPDLRETMG